MERNFSLRDNLWLRKLTFNEKFNFKQGMLLIRKNGKVMDDKILGSTPVTIAS